MKKWMKKLALLAVAAAMVLTVIPFAALAAEPAWQDNVLINNPMKRFGVELSEIKTVTFQDTLEGAPELIWYMGSDSSDSVIAWITWRDNGKLDVVFAAEGGINGKEACKKMFLDCTELEEVNFNGAFHTEEAERMDQMFENCISLKELDLSTLNTANVTNMQKMFYDCWSLEKVDVTSFDTSKVESMYCMFAHCYKLVDVDVSGFNTENVTNLGCMFSRCKSLEKVDVSGFKTGNVWNMEHVFRWCAKLEEPDVSSWDLSGVTYYSYFMDQGRTINGDPWQLLFWNR